MEFKTATAQEAADDFIANVWPHLFPGERGHRNRVCARVRMFIQKAKNGQASPEYIAKYLTEFGGKRYKIELTFKVQTNEQ